jgi:hypothetical protein
MPAIKQEGNAAMDILVGSTGFVGSNLASQHGFEKTYNSKNIEQAYGTNPDLCVYSGVRAEKFLADNDPEGDMRIIKNAMDNIKKINPKRLVLISTIDVFSNSCGADEDAPVNTDGLRAYGYNRYCLEQWCRENVDCLCVVRLPGLFGKNIKKNFIYDLIHILPSMLSEAKFRELADREPAIARHYVRQDNGFYQCVHPSEPERQALKSAFERLKFSALNFTDHRAVFQFYNLAYLWRHIQVAMRHNLPLAHLAVEPVSANEIYYALHKRDFVNEVTQNPPIYDFRTKYDALFGGRNGYIFTKEQVLADIISFASGASV